VLPDEEARKREKELRAWDEAFALYMGGDFKASGRKCLELLTERPDEKLYHVFAERAETMGAVAPEDWDGVYTYESK
jgi:hypothetical protein